MAENSPFRNVINFFDTLGIFDVVLPFLLVFTIVFALLERTKVLGMEEIDGKRYTKKNLNAVAAFVVSFLVIASSELVQVITTVSSNFVVLLFLSILFLLLVGSFFQEKEHAVFLKGGWKNTFMVIMFIGLVFIFLDAFNMLDTTFDFLQGNNQGEIVGSAILLIIVVLIVAWLTQDKHKHKHDDDD